MDWANERYVRLYTRNTTTWRRLGWSGQCVLMHLLRLVDRAGVLDIGDLPPWEAMVVNASAPEDVARDGMDKLMELGTVVHDGDRLVLPAFIEAQEASQSDAQRARTSRERRAALSQNVTAPSRNVTPASQVVTPRHTPSQAVTPSVPSVLNQPEEECETRTREAGSATLLKIAPAENGNDQSIAHDLRIGFTRRYQQATSEHPNERALGDAISQLARWVRSTAPLKKLSERDLGTKVLEGFFASAKARENRFRPGFLAFDPGEWLEPPRAPTAPANHREQREAHDAAKEAYREARIELNRLLDASWDVKEHRLYPEQVAHAKAQVAAADAKLAAFRKVAS